MIGKLRKKFTVLVLAVLLILFSTIVFSISFLTWNGLEENMESVLQVLTESGGRRPGRRDHRFPAGPGQPEQDEPANLHHYYSIRLDENGNVLRWYSDRKDLYDEEQIYQLAAMIVESGEKSGRFGSQFWRLTPRQEGSLAVVLDARLEVENVKSLARTTATVGALAYIIMSFGAVLLIRRMTRPAQEAFEKQKQFVWDASHELKTPLAVISANAEVLSGEIGENEWLGYIRSEVQRTDKLVQGLLTLARLDRDGLPMAKTAVNLSQAVMQVALPFESTVFEAGKTMVLEVAENVHCMGDSAMLQQLVVILLSNAVKYSEEKGIISVFLEQKGEKAVLRVHNTGVPIAQEALPMIFDRFFRGDTSHNSENSGNGLGLAIAKNIVEAHKGKITVESTETEGTCFTIIL